MQTNPPIQDPKKKPTLGGARKTTILARLFRMPKRSFSNTQREGKHQAIQDRRENLPQVKHAGSYASTHGAELAALNPTKCSAPKRKYALLVGYCGSDYVGLQMYV